VQRAI
jgi:hypothetical protein